MFNFRITSYNVCYTKLLRANATGKVIGVVAQKDEVVEEPTPNDIYHIGTVARIIRVLKMPDGNTTVILQGKKRFEIDAFTQEEPYLKATIKEVPEVRPGKEDQEFSTIIDSIKELAIEIIKESPNIPTEATFAIRNIDVITSYSIHYTKLYDLLW